MKTIYALYQYTPDDASVLYVSEDREKLTKKLKELARDYANEISGYDSETFDMLYKDSIDGATVLWSDEDEEYPYVLAIEAAELI